MPNYCYNWGSITAQKSLAADLHVAIKENRLLTRIHPTPLDNLEEWGTKWDIECCNVGDLSEPDNEGYVTIEFSFLSAWSPPTDAYKKLWEWEGVEDINMCCEESGLDFCGRWHNGEDEIYNCCPYPDDCDDNEDFDHSEFWHNWVREVLG